MPKITLKPRTAPKRTPRSGDIYKSNVDGACWMFMGLNDKGNHAYIMSLDNHDQVLVLPSELKGFEYYGRVIEYVIEID